MLELGQPILITEKSFQIFFLLHTFKIILLIVKIPSFKSVETSFKIALENKISRRFVLWTSSLKEQPHIYINIYSLGKKSLFGYTHLNSLERL